MIAQRCQPVQYFDTIKNSAKNNEEESLQNLEENVLKTISTFESRCLALYADKNKFIMFYRRWKINIVEHLELYFFSYFHL